MDVNGYSAYIMDLLVKRINEYKSTLDYNVALKEYALSTLTETRNLSLGYGCANIEQSLSANINQTGAKNMGLCASLSLMSLKSSIQNN